MDDNTKFEIVNWWVEHPEKFPELPEHLNSTVSKDEVIHLITEIEVKDQGRLLPSDIINYRDKIGNRISKERELKIKEKDLDLQNRFLDIQNKGIELQDKVADIQKEGLGVQKSVKRSQWVVAAVMVVSAIITLASTFFAASSAASAANSSYYQQQSYLLTYEANKPKFVTGIDCSEWVNNSISVSASVFNKGGSGTYIVGHYFADNISIKPEQRDFYNVSMFIEAGAIWKPNPLDIILPDYYPTAPSFSVGYRIECFDRTDATCTILEREAKCNYYNNGSGYVQALKCI